MTAEELKGFEGIDPFIRDKTLAALPELRLIDDTLMKVVFQNNLPLAQFVLRIIVGNPELVIIKENSEHKLARPDGGRSVCLDVLARDSEGRLYDLEIQRADKGASPRRARYHSAILDMDRLNASDDFDKLHETYIIFITENDYFGKGELSYSYDRINTKTGEPLGDGTHIIYLNASYSNPEDNSDLAMLMQDFMCSSADKAHHEIIAKELRYYKDIQEGEKSMCKFVEEIMEYKEQQYQNEKFQSAKELLTMGLTAEQIAKAMTLPLETVEALAREQSEVSCR